jgi:hypothetical protein
MDVATELANIRILLQNGDVQGASDKAAVLQKEIDADARAAAGIPAEPAAPRAADLVILDLFEAMIMHMGNRPQLQALLKELQAVAAPPPAKAPDPAI